MARVENGAQTVIRCSRRAPGRFAAAIRDWAKRSLFGLTIAALLAPGAAQVAQAEQDAPTVALSPVGAAPLAIVDPGGWTLYAWAGDFPGQSRCYEICASIWPPYTIDTGPVPPEGLPGTLGLIAREDGTWQVAFEGWPLYYFTGDGAPGEANGDGSTGFGARWSIVPLGPLAVAPPPAAPPSFATTPFTSQPPPSFTTPSSPPSSFFPQPPAMPPAAQPTPSSLGAPPLTVSIMDFEFRPASLNVQVGDTIVWLNTSFTAHTATSDTGLWNSGLLQPGRTASHTFNNTGTFTYQCAIHTSMKGTVVVGLAGTVPPTMGGPSTVRPPSSFGPTFPVGTPGYTLGSQSTIQVLAPPIGNVALNWPASPVAQSYRIYQTPIHQPYNLQVVQTVSQPLGVLVTNVTLAGLSPGTTYLIQVRAVDADGLEVAIPVASNAGPPGGPAPIPGVPSALDVIAITPTTVTLAWNGTPGATSYVVYQAFSSSGPWVQATVTTTTTVLVTGLTASSTYYFQVKAVDAAGNQSPPSNTVSATAGSTLLTPTGLTVVSTTGTSVTLQWATTPGAVSYRISQASSSAGPFTPAVTVTFPSNTTALVSGLTPNTVFYFQVRAVDAGGTQSLASNTVSATTI